METLHFDEPTIQQFTGCSHQPHIKQETPNECLHNHHTQYPAGERVHRMQETSDSYFKVTDKEEENERHDFAVEGTCNIKKELSEPLEEQLIVKMETDQNKTGWLLEIKQEIKPEVFALPEGSVAVYKSDEQLSIDVNVKTDKFKSELEVCGEYEVPIEECGLNKDKLCSDNSSVTSPQFSGVIAQIRMQDADTPVYRCTYCDYTADVKQMLVQHVTADHQAEIYICAECEFTTKSRYYLTRHITRKHNKDDELYMCTQCNYVSKVKAYLDRHVNRNHNAATKSLTKIYRCEDCGFSTKHRTPFVQHIKVQHVYDTETFKCAYCNFTTKYKRNLSRHATIKHSEDDEVYKCSICDYTTKIKVYLITHAKRNHKHAGKKCIISNTVATSKRDISKESRDA